MLGLSMHSRSEDWRLLYPFESHWLELPGGRMHYIDEFGAGLLTSPNGRPEGSDGAGSGDPRTVMATASPPTNETLLFVHGNPTWSFHWRRLILSLRSRYRCIAPDHLGCGLSDKPKRFLTLENHIESLRQLVETLNLARLTLVAQDWGGAIGLGAMLRMPERLERIILYNTGAFPPPYIPWRIRICRAPFIGRLAVQGANAFSRAALRMTLARRRELEPAAAAGYLVPYDSWANRRAVYGFVRDIPSRPTEPTWQTLTKIERMLPSFADRPAMLVWGMRDWCFRPDCLQRFIDAWPNAEVHRLADVGHWVVEDAPEEARNLVERFLDSSRELAIQGVTCQVSGVRNIASMPDT